jgi:hypothetical protein
LLFWNEQWLKKIDPAIQPALPSAGTSEIPLICTLGTLIEATRVGRSSLGHPDELFSCQGTEVSAFSSPLPWWHVGQYIRDLLSGNVNIWDFLVGMFIGAVNLFQCLRGGADFGSVHGMNTKTPPSSLNLCPGDLVQVKSKIEISQTLNPRGKNRGLSFRPEMVSHCGGQYRVVRRVKKIIRPATGKMMSLGGDCFILDGVVCTGKMKRFCPRSVYNYWRENWLTKIEEEDPVRVQAEKPATDATDYTPLPETSPQPKLRRSVSQPRMNYFSWRPRARHQAHESRVDPSL